PGEDLTDQNYSGVLIPIISQTMLTGPAVVGANTPFALNMRTGQELTRSRAIHGSYVLTRDGEEIGRARTDGNESFWVDGLPAGDHEFLVEFTPDAVPSTPAQGPTLFSKSSKA